MFERFTAAARQVIVIAQTQARELRHNYIGTEHLLLALMLEGDGVAARALGNLGLGVERVRERVVAIIGPGEEEVPGAGQIPFTPRAKKVLELALRESLSLGHDYIGTEHLLLGLVREGEGVAAQVLADFDADAARVRREVLRLLGQGEGWSEAGAVSAGASERRPHPLRPPLDFAAAGVLWRPDRILRGALRELEGVAARVLEEQLGLRVARVSGRRRPEPGQGQGQGQGRPPAAPATTRAVVHALRPEVGRARGPRERTRTLQWARASLLWRPEGLELRVPLHLEEAAMAAFATDRVWQAEPFTRLRRELWRGWLALASPTLLDDVDPAELRRALDEALARAVAATAADAAPGRVEGFLARLRE